MLNQTRGLDCKCAGLYVNRDVTSLFLHILYDALFIVTGIRIENGVWKASVSGVNRVHTM